MVLSPCTVPKDTEMFMERSSEEVVSQMRSCFSFCILKLNRRCQRYDGSNGCLSRNSKQIQVFARVFQAITPRGTFFGKQNSCQVKAKEFGNVEHVVLDLVSNF